MILYIAGFLLIAGAILLMMYQWPDPPK